MEAEAEREREGGRADEVSARREESAARVLREGVLEEDERWRPVIRTKKRRKAKQVGKERM